MSFITAYVTDLHVSELLIYFHLKCFWDIIFSKFSFTLHFKKAIMYHYTITDYWVVIGYYTIIDYWISVRSSLI